jgi:hypothetical protein
MKHIELLKNLDACSEAVEWVETQPDLETAWNNCKRSDWMLWLDMKLNLFNDRDRRLMTCAFVRRTPLGDGRVVWDLLTNERSRNAVEVAERHANGDATDDELSTAWDAARSAAWDGAGSAACYAARSAAGSAARSAAWDGAGSAACYAARSAAGSAARSAAWDAAWYAAEYAARDAQLDIIREFGNPFNGNDKKP